MPLAANLGTKAPGQLIKSEDWNALVAGVNAIESALDARITSVEGAVTTLGTRMNAAEANIGGLRSDVDDILASTFRITLATAKVNYALGELAEITATVRDARGQIPATIATAPPSVDFVTTWGNLKAAPGFVSVAGEAERSISVQCNAQGEARVRLSSEILHDMTNDMELEFSNFLDTRVGTQNLRFADVVLSSSTPSDQGVATAYKAATASYDSPQTGNFREYVDSYYVANSTRIAGKIAPSITNQWRQQWRDHHITVLAFGKADGDPRTPDSGRGANAIQVTFRDWIGSWMIIDYIPGAAQRVPQYISVLQGAITLDYEQSANLMRDAVQQRVQGFGLLGKTREYEALRGALDQVNPPQPVAFMAQLRQSMKSAVTLQQSFQQAQLTTPGAAAEEVALNAFTSTAVRADSAVAGVNAQVLQVQQAVQLAQQNISSLGSRLDATAATGGQIDQLRANLTTVTDQVHALRALGDPTVVSDRLNFISSLDNRLTRIERGGT